MQDITDEIELPLIQAIGQISIEKSLTEVIANWQRSSPELQRSRESLFEM